MSNLEAGELHRLQERVLTLYATITVLMLLGIAVLAVYSLRVGALTSPGARYVVRLRARADAPHGRGPVPRRRPHVPRLAARPTDHANAAGAVTPQAQVQFLQVLVFVVAAAGIAYLIAGLLT